MNEVLTFQEAEAAHRRSAASPNEILRIIFRNPEVWAKARPHMINGGVLGSVTYDHAAVAIIVLNFDAENGGLLAKFKLTGPKLTGHITAVLKPIFLMEKGRILGNRPPPDAHDAAQADGAGAA